MTLPLSPIAALRIGLTLLSLGLLGLMVAATSTSPPWPVLPAVLLFVGGALFAWWGVEAEHREAMSTAEGRLDNVRLKIRALQEFADGLGLDAVVAIELHPEDFELCVDAALEQGLVGLPRFVREGWRPESLTINRVLCKAGARFREDEDDDSEHSGC